MIIWTYYRGFGYENDTVEWKMLFVVFCVRYIGGLVETFRFWDEYNYEYEIFSILNSACAWTSVIFAGKHDYRRHSTKSFSENVVVTETDKF